MQTKNFLDGLEETIARIVSLVITLTFFGLFYGSKTPVSLDWYSLIGVLALFWLVYESVSYLLYVVFNFFSSKNQKSVVASNKEAGEKLSINSDLNQENASDNAENNNSSF